MLKRLAPWVALTWFSLLAVLYHKIGPAALAAFSNRALHYGLDLLLLGLICLVSFTLGRAILRRIGGPKESAEGALFSLAVGLGALSLSVLMVGLMGLLYPLLLQGGIALGAVLSLYVLLREGSFSHLAAALRQRERLGPPGIFPIFLLLASAGAVGYSLVTNALVPPLEWDSIAYHLALPKLYLAQHRIASIPTLLYSNWPSNMEMLYTLSLALGSEVTAQLLALATALLTATAIFLFCQKNLDWRIGLLGSAIYLTTPLVIRYGGAAMADIPLGFFTFLSAFAFVEWRRSQGREWLVLSGLMAGFAAGTKMTGVISIVMFLLALFYQGLTRKRGESKESWKPLFGQAGLFSAMALVTAGPWYLKSLVLMGNPVWPFLQDVFPSKDWDSMGTALALQVWSRGVGVEPSLANFLLLPWHLTVDHQRFGESWGIMPLAFLPLILLGAASIWRQLAVPFLLAASYTSLWFFLPQLSRYLIPVVALLSPLAAWGFYLAYDKSTHILRFLLPAALSIWLIIQSPLVNPQGKERLEDRLRYVTGSLTRQTFLAEHVDVMEVFEYANAQLPRDAKILLLPYENRGYYLDRPYLWGNPVGQRVLKYEDLTAGEELWKWAKERGVTHVIVNPKVDFPTFLSPHLQGLLAAFTQPEYLRPLFRGKDRMVLYQVN